MTGDKAAPAAAARNLVMRVLAALVLAPLALAIAYAGGWLWATLVTLASIGLYVEWLMIVGLARKARVTASGVTALAIAGICLIAARIVSVRSLVASNVRAVTPPLPVWDVNGRSNAIAQKSV